ncbi:MAG: mechanosensitive ion channel family protein, partial [Rhodospirillales bacterium]
LEALAATLEDDARRQELIARIKALIAVRQKAEGKEPVDSLGAVLIDMLSERLKETSGQLAAAVDALSDFPLLFRWLRAQAAGVDRFDDSAVIIKARFKTAPIKQWFVGREFNRRMKKHFDELGIEIPFPHSTLYFGKGRTGNAPVGRFFIEKNERRPADANKARRRPSTITRVDLPTGDEAGTDGGADDG